MSMPGKARGTTVQDDAAAPEDAAQGEASAPGASAAPDTPAPLTSLSSLLGGSVESGAACAADGTCD